VVAVGGPLDAGSVPGGVEGVFVVAVAGPLVVAGPFGWPTVVAGPPVVGADAALVVDVEPADVVGSPVVDDVVAALVVLGTEVDPGSVVGGTVSPAPAAGCCRETCTARRSPRRRGPQAARRAGRRPWRPG